MTFKLLIVDDETTVRKGLTNFMNWSSIECEVIGNASDGGEAIEFLKKNPVDIVITDIKMPDTDGLEVARYVYKNCPDTRVIILTGYAEFEYAQTAISYNVSSFIIKPMNKKELLESVQSIQKQLITSKKRSSIEKEEYAFLKEQLLQDMTRLPYSSSFEKRMKDLDLHLQNYYIVCFQLSSDKKDISLLKEIIITEKKNAYCYRYDDLIITIYFLETVTDSVPKYILSNCHEIIDIAYTLDSYVITAGISRCHTTPSSFGLAVSEAICSLRSLFYSEDSIALCEASMTTSECDLTAENSLDLFQFEGSLHNWAFDDTENMINKIFLKFKNNFVDSWDAKNICSQIYYICSRTLIQKGGIALSSKHLACISRATNIFSLENAITALVKDTKELLLQSVGAHSQLTENTLKYIYSHLSDSLSLEIIAAALHVSPSHLSRTFKKECGDSLSEYINKTRVEKAKEYLANSDTLIYEVAEQTGYNDVAYFSAIFKKYTGKSPKDYRAFQHKSIL